MDSYCQRLRSLISVSESLRHYLTSLAPEAWCQPSACSRWQVADVVAHLVVGAETYAANISRGLQGDTSTPPGRLPAGSDAAISSAERIAAAAVTHREQLGRRLLANFEETDRQLNALLSGLSTPDRGRPCYHGGSLVPAGDFIDLRINELTVHHWDIRSGLEPQTRLATQGLASALLMFSRSLAAGSARWAFWPGPRLAVPVRYRFEVTGPVPLQADIVVEGDRVVTEEPGAAAANATLRCGAETFILLMYGRVTPAAALGSGRLSVEGDRQLVDQFNQWFRGI